MTDFVTTMHGIKCICRVTFYSPYRPAITNRPAEDCAPAEPAEFEYEILNMDRTPTKEVEVPEADEIRLMDEYEAHITAIKHAMDF